MPLFLQLSALAMKHCRAVKNTFGVCNRKENDMAEPRTSRYADIVPAKKTVIGSSVVNSLNEDLGKIEDLVLDAAAGRIAYAVLSFGGFLGMGDKYFAIPWDAFRFNLSEKR